MSEERLKEIHDSIEFQMQLQQAVGYKSRYDDLLVEEIDLYNEVIDLQEKIKQLKDVIDEAREHIEETCYYPVEKTYSSMTINEVKELLQILDKVGESND